jgi:hypothetical protein
MAGVVSPFLEAANRVTSAAIITHGRTLARMQFTPEDSPYSFVAMVPQDVTERLLVEETEIVGIVRPSIGSGRLGVAMKIEYFHDSRPDADASNRLSVEADQCKVTCWGNGASLGQVS